MKHFELWAKIAAHLGHYWVRFADPLRTAYVHGGWAAVNSAYRAILALEADRGSSDWIGISPPSGMGYVHVTGSGRLHISASEAGVYVEVHRPAGKIAEVRFSESGLEWRNSLSDGREKAVCARHIQAIIGIFDAVCDSDERRREFRNMIVGLHDMPSCLIWHDGWPFDPWESLIRDDLEFTHNEEPIGRAKIIELGTSLDAHYIAKNLEPTFSAFTEEGELIGFGRKLPTGAYHIDGSDGTPQTRSGEMLYVPEWVGSLAVDYHPFAYSIIDAAGGVVRSITRAQFLAVSGENNGVKVERLCAGLPYACYRLRAHSWNPVTGEWQEVNGDHYPSTYAGEVTELRALADLSGRLNA